MNLMAFLQRGIGRAPTAPSPIALAAETARANWLDALMADECRAWMALGEVDTGMIDGMATMLTLAGFANSHDTRHANTPDIRIIRGALSAALECMDRGGVVQLADAQAFSSAAARARTIIESASQDAIVYAATRVRDTVGV